MRISWLGGGAITLVLVVACGSSGGGGGASAGPDAATSSSSSGGGSGGSSSGSGGSSGGSSGGGGLDGSAPPAPGDGGAFPPPGNPAGTCKTLTLPSEAQLVDTSKPTTVVGTGTAASCTFAALSAAVQKGGIVTFDCGPTAVTIPVTATLTPALSKDTPTTVSTVIDGGNMVTLDGRSSVRIMSWVHNTWRTNGDTLTLQRIRLVNGKATPTQAIPACPPSGSISNTQCSTGYDDGQGGALYMQDGNLRVIDCYFDHNQAALLGPDTGGGAMYLFGTGNPAYIAGSTFSNNTASNAGGVGMLWAGAFIFDSVFDGNSAVGNGANDNDATKCTCDNGSNKNQIGSGGNGGAIYKDGGDAANLTVCGTTIQNNTANEFGPAIFLTADGSNAKLVLDDDTITRNSTPISYWQWCTDVSTDNPHTSGSTTGSPSPIDTTFCNASGGACSMTCSS
jgi:hypothetical protein